MTPNLAKFDFGDRDLVQAVVGGDEALRSRIGSNFQNIALRKASLPVPFAAIPVLPFLARAFRQFRLNMAPTNTALDHPDVISIDAVSRGQDVRRISRRQNILDICLAELCGALFALGETLPIHRILNIVGLSADDQVARIHTGRVVAPVAHDKARRDRAVDRLIGKSVGKAQLPVNAQNAIAEAVLGCAPIPTLIRVSNGRVFKKASVKRLSK